MTSSDVADREVLVLPPRNRVEHNRRADVREDEEKLEEGAQVVSPPFDGGGVPGRTPFCCQGHLASGVCSVFVWITRLVFSAL
jgi:hypothetical protein